MTLSDNIAEAVLAESIALCPELAGTAGIVLAVSGGLDSMVLLDVFDQLAKEQNWHLVVGHLNHCLRGAESDRDEQFVIEQCRQRRISCISRRVDIPAYAVAEGQSVESAARSVRYDFLAGLCQEHKCSHLATAHHADDNAETVLHRIIRGTGIKGLAGIRSVRYIAAKGDTITIFRPLLQFSRVELETYRQKAGLEFCHDSSNDSTDYTRNQIRQMLLPQLAREYNPAITRSLNDLACIATDSDIILTELAISDLERTRATVKPGLLELELKAICELSPGRVRNMLRNALETIGCEMAGIGFQTIDYLLQATKDQRSRKLNELPGGVRAEICDLRLIVSVPAKDLSGYPRELAIPGQTDTPGLIRLNDQKPIKAIIARSDDKFTLNNARNKPANCEIIDLDRVYGQMTVGPLLPGLKYQPLSMAGSQTTGDIMTNHKIPRYQRQAVMAIYDEKGIICIPGHRIAERVKVTEMTGNILILEIALLDEEPTKSQGIA